ncbi:MAG: sulfurtransferase [Cyanobacteria bacterium J06638_28]
MAQSATGMPTPLVDMAWLHEHLNDSQVVIIDCRFTLNDPDVGHQAYLEEHIPGAFYLGLDQDLSGVVEGHSGRHPLPNLATLVAKLASLGISSDPATHVVAYDSSKGAFAARLWWLLGYLGHPSVAVLDGGFPAWQAAEYPVSATIPIAPQPGQFVPDIQTSWVVDRDDILERQRQEESFLVDARSPERFRGEQEPIDPIAGSIPGATNFFWQWNLDADGYFKNPEELRQQWAKLHSRENPVFYCGSGVTACVNILGQAVLGHPLPKLFVGGWSAWCSHEASSEQ